MAEPRLSTEVVEHLLASPDATAQLFSVAYEELRAMASSRLKRLAAGQTLQATALVNEAYLRIAGPKERSWANRAHFFFVAGRAMRDILVEEARRKGSLKRGGDRHRVPIEFAGIEAEMPDEDILALHEALEKLEAEDPERARMVYLRYFAGLSAIECAEALEMSKVTFHRRWRLVWAWLKRELARSESPDAPEVESTESE